MITFHIRAATSEVKTLCGARATMVDDNYRARETTPARGYVRCPLCVARRNQLRAKERAESAAAPVT